MKNGMIIAVVGLTALLFSSAGLTQQPSTRGDGDSKQVNRITVEQVQALYAGGVAAKAGGVVRVDKSAFEAGSGLIAFDEVPLGTINPVYAPGDYGGGASNPTVSFGGFFQGQRLGAAAECPPGAALTGCVVDSPANPLALDPASPNAYTVNDSANPTSPVLSGSPLFNGPIAIVFDTDQAGVGLDGGFFDDINSTAITAFARNGSIIGTVTNEATGIEFLGLATADGSNSIAGLLFSLVGNEASGFAIDNVYFGKQGAVTVPGGPGIATHTVVPAMNIVGLFLLLLLLGGVGVVALRR